MTDNAFKILIVEDESYLQKMYRTAFEKSGCEVRISGEGMDGIVQAVEYHPDIILLDLLMPHVDGYELIRALHENSNLQIPIIILSNVVDQAAIEKAFALGANEYLRKIDFPPGKLVKKVLDFLQKKHGLS